MADELKDVIPSMDLRISDDDQTAWLACQYCGATIEWPFDPSTLGPGNDPDIDVGVTYILSCNFNNPKKLDGIDFSECPIRKWKPSKWRRIDVDDGEKVTHQGPMQIRDEFPHAHKK